MLAMKSAHPATGAGLPRSQLAAALAAQTSVTKADDQVAGGAKPAQAWVEGTGGTGDWRRSLHAKSMQLSTLVEAQHLSQRMREEMLRALGESEKKLPVAFNHVHDQMLQCKAAMMPVTKAIPRLLEAAHRLETEAVAAHERIRVNDIVLGRSQCGSASQLRGEREALISMLRSEIVDMEEVGSQAQLQPLATSTTKD